MSLKLLMVFAWCKNTSKYRCSLNPEPLPLTRAMPFEIKRRSSNQGFALPNQKVIGQPALIRSRRPRCF